MKTWNYNITWYHGSPLELTVLREGSTITPDKKLAETFSHKPSIVSIGDDGTIEHNGTLPGLLYTIAEEITADDVYPHPRTVLEEGKEWLTNRDMKLALVGDVPVIAEELLTEQAVEELRKSVSGEKQAVNRRG